MTAKANPSEGASLIAPNVTIKITLAKAEVAKSYQKQLTKLASQLKMPGFRQGKVPAKVAEEQLGRGHLIEHVLDELLPSAYPKAIADQKKAPITHPEFKIISAEKDQDWVVEAEIAEMPTVTLGKYTQHVKAGKKAAQQAKTDLEKAAKKDKKAESAKPMTPEQAKEHELQYIFRELVVQIKPKIPQLLLKHETQHEFQHLADQLKQLNISVDDYLKNSNKTMEQLSQELAVQTLSRLQLDLILGAVARDKKISVTPQDKEKFFAQIKDEKQRKTLEKDEHYLHHLEANLLKQKVVDSLLTV